MVGSALAPSRTGFGTGLASVASGRHGAALGAADALERSSDIRAGASEKAPRRAKAVSNDPEVSKLTPMDGPNNQRRMDWELVPPPAAGKEVAQFKARQAFEACYKVALDSPGDAEVVTALADSEQVLEEASTFKCDVVDAPRVEDDPDWESRVIDEYGDSDVDAELEDYIDERRVEPDCESCPYASRYSIFPMDPCEFSAGGLLAALEPHPELVKKLRSSMDSEDMLRCSRELTKVLEADDFVELEAVDTRDYLDQAAQFLRFWARHGFCIRATDLDVDLVTQAESEMKAAGAGPTLH